jgi:protein-tyrosine-phosphatase/tRNA A37 threonylcarbamoyladenosine synthetase subunit TsaC/SUA5/YrdC
VAEVISSRSGAGNGDCARVAEWLRAGKLVILPTETVYGVAASARSSAAMAALRALQSNPGNTWHTHDPQRVIEAVGIRHEAHRRLLEKLTPGGVRFMIETDRTSVDGEPEGTFVLEGSLCVRVADIVAAVDDGPTRLGQTSTPIRLTRAGGYRVLGEGAVDERTIDAAMKRVVLFVCSGNTCRSPMAEAIARDLFDKRPLSNMPLVAMSAGTSAFDGDGSTPEGDQALRHLGVLPRPHRSRLLTREMIREADAIFAMTRGHRASIVQMMPEAVEKVQLLQPSGRDIADPIGSGLDTYISTAEAIRAGILLRFRERGWIEELPGVSR